MASSHHRCPAAVRHQYTVLAARALLCTASAVVLLVSGLTWAAYRDLTDGMATSDALHVVRPGERGYVAPHLDDSVNLLLIGLDSRKDMNGQDLPKDFVEQQLHAGSSDIGGYNTNVLILMHIPADGGRVTAFSIARDDYVEEPGGESSVGLIPNLGMHKIKEAYGRAKFIAQRRLEARGETDKARIEAESREVGRESTIRAVQLLTGEHVDHLAEINLLGFYDIAQAVGPIQVCLNHPVFDPIQDGAGTGLKLPAGYSDLDAPTALQFVRQRFHLLRGDFDRNRRQQAFLSAVLRKLRDEGIVGDLGRMRSLFGVVKKDLVIDDSWDVLDFATRARNLTGGDAVFRELPITGQPVLPGDGSVNTVDPARIRRIVTTAFGDPDQAPPDDPSAEAEDSAGGSTPTSTPNPEPGTGTGATAAASDRAEAPSADQATNQGAGQSANQAPDTDDSPAERAVVDLYNATGRRGLATSAAGTLSAAGWPVDKTSTAPPQTRSTVYFGPGAQTAATRLATRLGLTATPLPAPGRRSVPGHVQVYLGADYTPPPDAGAGADAATQGSEISPSTAQTSAPALSAITANQGVTCVN